MKSSLGLVLTAALAMMATAGHAAAAKWLGIGAVISLMCGVASLLAVASGSAGLAAVLGALGLGTAIIVLFPAVAAAQKAAREARR